MKTALVVNPQARAFRRREKLISAVRRCARGGARVWVTDDDCALTTAAREIIEWGADRVVLCGGDGTLMAGVSALRHVDEHVELPEIVVAPAGTVATVARNWGQRADVLDTVVRATAGERPRVRLVSPTLQVTWKYNGSRTDFSTSGVSEERDGSRTLEVAETPRKRREGSPTLGVSERSSERRVGFILGTGLVAHFFEKYYARGGGGYARAASIVARTFTGSFLGDAYSRSVLDPLPCRLTVDGSELAPTAFSLVVTSVVRNLGLGMRVTHRAAEDPERPHLVASPLSARKLGPQAPRVLLARALKGADNFDGLYTELRIEFPEARGPWVLDGDVFFSNTVQVSAGPCVRVAAY